ncbi:MAG: DUF1571 domain-containing protein [Bacteroidia bacterium]|nr:DUF1571 domain-containing protein [Bacteroidia bacterium]
MNIYASERQSNPNSYISARSFVKIKYNPVKKIYFKNPEKGLEILYDPNVGHKALVKPHIFPYLPLWLDTRGNIMRKNQHYTIHELGFDFILKSIQMTVIKDKDFFKHARWAGSVMRNGYDCMLLIYENPSFDYTEYTVTEKDNLDLLCLKLCINHYIVRVKNDLYNDYKPVKKGTKLVIPNLYAKKAVIYFDKKTYLPVIISLYDDAGMFEHYEYTNIKINSGIPDEEFRKDFKEYKF